MSETAGWLTANQRYLHAALQRLMALLVRQGGGRAGHGDLEAATQALGAARAAMSTPPALETLALRFELSAFERDLLLLCAGVELDGAFGAHVARLEGDAGGQGAPTFSLAFAALPDTHWSAVTPAGPLRQWQLIDVQPGQGLLWSPLRIAERVLHYLAGVDGLDERLAGVVEPLDDVAELAPSQRRVADELAAAWRAVGSLADLPAVQLVGRDAADREAVASAACGELGLKLHRLSAHALPVNPAELHGLARLWEREATLGSSAVLIDCTLLSQGDTARENGVAWLAERLWGGVVISTSERRQGLRRSSLLLDVKRPDAAEQRQLWHDALPSDAARESPELDELVAHFDLGAAAIRGIAAGLDEPESAWERCRTQARPFLEGLAQRIEARAEWVDLVLPEEQLRVLHALLAAVRQRATVYGRWGFGREARGLGVTALFAGPSGTGKTLAAEVLARAMRLDLFRVDLSQVVNKYVGETEKNLRRVFDAAEEGGAVLLFDEADALFGKRSEVKDSHDRYANIETSYLLQRMEAYRGLALLTTNMKAALDTAFLRRLRFVVHFPFPDAALRSQLWRRTFPAQAPLDGIDFEKLARLNVSGGSIRSIALGAAFLAAEEGRALGMTHVLEAARIDSAKNERALTDAELRGWV